MMKRGISVFLGIDYSLLDNLEYIKNAHAAGFRHIFTSLHIPEASYVKIIDEFQQVINLSQNLEMKVIADISPNAYAYLGIKANDLSAFKDFGLAGIRLDYGFQPNTIAEYSNNSCGLMIELNASTISANFIKEIMESGANSNNLTACHNYYPRINTGISANSMQQKNLIFKQYKIPVSAFIALDHSKRGPFYDGLPTLEFTRNMPPHIVGQILLQLGVDNLFFGDAYASVEELSRLAQLNLALIELDLVEYNTDACYKEFFNSIHTNRPDSAEDVIRSQESRLLLLENNYVSRKIESENCFFRQRGSVCVDNVNYLRYSGELQICKHDLPADVRVNVVGQLDLHSQYLLEYIGDSQQFKFVLP